MRWLKSRDHVYILESLEPKNKGPPPVIASEVVMADELGMQFEEIETQYDCCSTKRLERERGREGGGQLKATPSGCVDGTEEIGNNELGAAWAVGTGPWKWRRREGSDDDMAGLLAADLRAEGGSRPGLKGKEDDDLGQKWSIPCGGAKG
ncbi:hypothetical protein M0R45_008631 [Rubus argutus]|uniref:Uncharacterized protein n=1 Tax=Rubus argutus TaxID=59490 RepID=A0AAW1Y511_RUBAR